MLLDGDGDLCLVIKSWPWDDRVCVLSRGHVELVAADELDDLPDESILRPYEVKDGKD